jgi:hypothetical protein
MTHNAASVNAALYGSYVSCVWVMRLYGLT